MTSQFPVRYESTTEDSARWAGFTYRAGDIVISTPPKSGTTWMQMICALLVFQRTDLPLPLRELSPWLDCTMVPIDDVLEKLSAQRHRRFVKTHTPLDGIPLDPRAHYIVVARHPLDMAVSMYHQMSNMDRARMRALTGRPERAAPPPLHEWLLQWIDTDVSPRADMDSLPCAMWHLTDAWNRRGASNATLVHYDELSTHLGSEMRRVANLLGITVPERTWPELIEAATFVSMRDAAHRLAPDPADIFKDATAFFRRGGSGAGRDVLSSDELARYHARVAHMAPADLLDWLHGPPHTPAPQSP
ncbi:sulfotransferase domain-containing protein [Streptomyces sp. NEAU-S77]|uniref:sulfotransferase domain-containing protein n=1 Tax=Streptomyces sp. NEAU-S77 TaxID=3411033 RepID=UPI003B9FA2B7